MPIIDITGLDKAAVLTALVNGTRSQGFGRLYDRGTVRIAEVRATYSEADYAERFDYVFGRPIKATLSGNTFDAFLYDRDAGAGAAARAIAGLRADLRADEAC